MKIEYGRSKSLIMTDNISFWILINIPDLSKVYRLFFFFVLGLFFHNFINNIQLFKLLTFNQLTLEIVIAVTQDMFNGMLLSIVEFLIKLLFFVRRHLLSLPIWLPRLRYHTKTSRRHSMTVSELELLRKSSEVNLRSRWKICHWGD